MGSWASLGLLVLRLRARVFEVALCLLSTRWRLGPQHSYSICSYASGEPGELRRTFNTIRAEIRKWHFASALRCNAAAGAMGRADLIQIGGFRSCKCRSLGAATTQNSVRSARRYCCRREGTVLGGVSVVIASHRWAFPQRLCSGNVIGALHANEQACYHCPTPPDSHL
jgi:hypothetical protein